VAHLLQAPHWEASHNDVLKMCHMPLTMPLKHMKNCFSRNVSHTHLLEAPPDCCAIHGLVQVRTRCTNTV